MVRGKDQEQTYIPTGVDKEGVALLIERTNLSLDLQGEAGFYDINIFVREPDGAVSLRQDFILPGQIDAINPTDAAVEVVREMKGPQGERYVLTGEFSSEKKGWINLLTPYSFQVTRGFSPRQTITLFQRESLDSPKHPIEKTNIWFAWSNDRAVARAARRLKLVADTEGRESLQFAKRQQPPLKRLPNRSV